METVDASCGTRKAQPLETGANANGNTGKAG